MIDPIAAALSALTSHSPMAIGLVFLAGVLTSVGPCVAPRYIALAAITNGRRQALLPTVSYVLGVVGAFVALGFVAGLLGTLQPLAGALYAVLSVGLIAGGCIALVRAVPAPAGNHACSQHRERPDVDRSLGAVFLLGAASAFVLSPCCTPIVAAIAATSTAIGKPLCGALLLSSYAAGHAVPLLFAGGMSAVVQRLLPSRVTAQAPAIVGAVLMLTLGIYYGVLA